MDNIKVFKLLNKAIKKIRKNNDVIGTVFFVLKKDETILSISNVNPDSKYICNNMIKNYISQKPAEDF